MTHPDCSIIIATRNRPGPLRDLLTRLERLETTGLGVVELLVVNDGGVREPVQSLQAVFTRWPLRVVHRPWGGPGAARNAGAENACGRLLVFTDDDCLPDADWLRELAGAHRRHPAALLGGVTYNGMPGNRWSAASEAIVTMARRFYNRGPGGPSFFPSNNMAVPAEGFREIGGFDPRYTFASEDRDLCDRWRHVGRPLVEVAAARVAHVKALTFTGFLRQHVRYGVGARRYHGDRRRRGSGKLVSDMRFHRRLPALFLRSVPPGQRVRLLLPMVCWQVANLLGFLRAAVPVRSEDAG